MSDKGTPSGEGRGTIHLRRAPLLIRLNQFLHTPSGLSLLPSETLLVTYKTCRPYAILQVPLVTMATMRMGRKGTLMRMMMELKLKTRAAAQRMVPATKRAMAGLQSFPCHATARTTVPL